MQEEEVCKGEGRAPVHAGKQLVHLMHIGCGVLGCVRGTLLAAIPKTGVHLHHLLFLNQTGVRIVLCPKALTI